MLMLLEGQLCWFFYTEYFYWQKQECGNLKKTYLIKGVNMRNLLQLLPNAENDELNYIQGLLKDMPDEKVQQFALIYNSRRKDPQTILLLTLVGFLGVAGIQRFIIDQIGMGLLYVFTAGLCLVGTIVDIINYKSLAFEFNQKVARQVAGMISIG
jgi:TM2 domain-containing membrane protein YozV